MQRNEKYQKKKKIKKRRNQILLYIDIAPACLFLYIPKANPAAKRSTIPTRRKG